MRGYVTMIYVYVCWKRVVMSIPWIPANCNKEYIYLKSFLVEINDDDDDKFLTIKTKQTHYGQGTMQATRYKTHEYK